MFPPSHFRFDYESQTIRIPVWAGKINFIFGTEPASYSFPDNGIYKVNFSSDWNSVTNASKVSSLSESFAYLDPHADNPPPQDTTAPIIIVSSPQNKTYSVAEILLKFTLNEKVSQISYSLDGKANVTISENSVILPVLPDGSHNIVVYASDLAGNTGASRIIRFTVDTQPPNISLLSPQNRIYNTTDISLTLTANERIRWFGYSVDGQANVTISGNHTLGLDDGMHNIVVYARDLAGNIGASSTVYFTKDTVAPTISILSPQNTTYYVTEVPLTFVISETTSCISYSLDGQDNVIITGNMTLTGLPHGSHTLTVYATDEAGNNEISETIYFITAEPFPTMIAATLSMAAVGGTASGIYYLKKAKNGKR
jgi:hypothetical protein